MNTIHLIYDSLDKDMTGPHRIGTTLLIAVSTCLISLICALILWVLDIKRRKVVQEDTPSDPCMIFNKKTDSNLYKILFFCFIADEFHISDIRHFSASLYCVFIICVFYYVAIFPFIAAAQLLYISKYNLSAGWANACNSLVYFMYVLLNKKLRKKSISI